MENDIFDTLKRTLADLTNLLFVTEKEVEYVAANTDDDNLYQLVANLKDSNKEVIKLFYEIKSNESAMQDGLYADESALNNLKKEVNSLSKAVENYLASNKELLLALKS